MQLIEPLMGGVTGAEGGTAEIWNRGDTARARYFLDFEGTQAVYSGIDIDLDAYGSAEVYTSLSCLVRVRSQAGAVVRTFVILGVAHADELDADSFTDDTVGEALDRWVPSAGKPDFQVTLNSAATNLSFVGETTFAQMQTLCAVKSFGAIGDGVTDDSVAIGKAIAFASRGGGTVLFNAGTYSITSTIVVPGTVTLQGTGPGGTVIVQQSHTARIFSVQSATATAYIRGMTIRYASTSGDYSQYGVDILSGSRVQFNNVSFGTSAFPLIKAIAVGSGGALDASTEVAISDCSIYAVTRAYADFRTDARPDSIPTLNRCIIAMIGATSAGAYVTTSYAAITNCAFSGAVGAVTNDQAAMGLYAGSVSDVSSAQSVSISGCTFANPSSNTAIAFRFYSLSDSEIEFHENRNALGGNVVAQHEFTTPGIRGVLEFGTLHPRTLRATTNTDSNATQSRNNSSVVLTRTNTSALTCHCSPFPKGSVCRVFVQNSGGGTLTQGLNTTSFNGAIDDFPNGTAGVSMNNGTARLWEYVSYPGTNTGIDDTRCAPIVDGAQVGPLT